jgi:hypothetical protein
MTDDDLQTAWNAGDSIRASLKAERREQQRRRKRYGMQVSGTSVKVLATLIPKPKKRSKRGRKR